MSGLLQDVRYAWRMLRKSPGFTAVVVLTMGLGIGVNTSIYTITRGVMHGPLAIPDESRVVRLLVTSSRRPEPYEMSSPDFLDHRERAKSYSDLGAYYESMAYLTLGREPERFNSAGITPGGLRVLGVRPVIGRLFTDAEGVFGSQYGSVILSHRVWKDRLGADPHVLGRTFKINGRVRTVVGVMPPDFRFPEISDFWIPLAFKPGEDGRDEHYLEVIGRLKPGVTVAQAGAEAASIQKQLNREYPGPEQTSAVVWTNRAAINHDTEAPMRMLSFAVMFVLLIACANVANLMLARATARRREIGVRAALGAGRGRIARQLLVESMMVSLMGGALGVFIAYWGNDFVLRTIPIEMAYWMRFDIDTGVLVFTVVLSLAAGVLFGLAPVAQLWGANLLDALKEGGIQAGTARGTQWMRNGLVVAEVALALVLLVGSGLLVRSLAHMQDLRHEFDPTHVLTGRVTLPVAVYPSASSKASFFAEFVERLATVPGVAGAGAGSIVPHTRNGSSTALTLEGHEGMKPSERPVVRFDVVTPGYFETLRVPVLAGRTFTATDDSTNALVAVVSRSAARKLWPGEEALGRRFKGGQHDSAWATVVGVVGDVRQNVANTELGQVYVPHAQNANQTMALFIRTRGEPAVLASEVRRLLRQRDPDLPFYETSSLEVAIHEATWENRIYAWLMTVYSAIALVIASIGIYGVMAYRVSQRTREIGIRMALGARQEAVVGMIVGQGLRLTVLGLGLGLAGAFALTRLMSSLLFDVNPNDPPTFVGVVAILAASGLLACWLPAWRAARVDPMTALRYE